MTATADGQIRITTQIENTTAEDGLNKLIESLKNFESESSKLLITPKIETDTAEKNISDLKSDVSALSQSDANINVIADSGSAEKQIDGIKDKAESLGQTDPVITPEVDTSSAEQKIKNLQSSLTDLAAKTASAFAVKEGITSFIEIGTAFEDSVAKVSTLTDAAITSTDTINDGLLKVSSDTGIAADEMGEALYQALSAGVPASEDMSESMEFLGKSATLAKGGFTDITSAVDVSTSVMNAYGMGLEDVDGINKVLIQTQNKGKTTVDELAQSLSGVTPTAAALGVGFGEVGASLATMTAQGVPTSEAVTGLNSLFAELSDTGSTTSSSLAEATEAALGQTTSFQDLQAQGYTVSDVMQLLSDYASDTGVSMYDLMGSQEAVSAALQITGDNAGTFSENLSAIGTNLDVVGEAADTAGNTVSQKFTVLINGAKNALISFYTDAIQPAAVAIADFFGWFADPANQTAVTLIAIGVGTLATAIIAYTVAQNAAAIGTAIATVATTAFGAAVAFLTSPITLIVLAIGALIAIIVLLVKNWDKVKEVAATVWDKIKEIWGVVADWFQKYVIDPIVTSFTAFKYTIIAIWDAIWGAIKKVINAILNGVESFVNGIVKGINILISGLNKAIGLGEGVAKALGFDIDFQIPKLNTVSLPRLAQGAVIPPNREFMAILGDQKRGVNIETPLATMIEAFKTAFSETGGSSMSIGKIADTLVIREESDIDKIANKLYAKFQQTSRSRGIVNI